MNFQQRLAISYYKTIAVLNDQHKIYVAQHQENNKIYIKKILDVYNLQVFQYLMQHPVEGLPAIIEYYEDEENQQLILIEEYISGDTLQNLIQNKQLTMDAISHYTHELCKILDTIHSATPPIIHRDLKPSNIIINNADHVILIDFNVARNYKSESQSDTVLLGTKGYAAPEQYGFGSSSPRTDIYALGIVLKEMLDTLDAPGSQTEASLRNSYYQAVYHCTQFKPEDRFHSAMDLLDYLDSFSEAGPYSASRRGHNSRQKPYSDPESEADSRQKPFSDPESEADSRQKPFSDPESEADSSRKPYSEPGSERFDSQHASKASSHKSLPSWRRFLPPGFRTGTRWKMILAALSYVFLIMLCASLESESPLFGRQSFENLWVALSFFSGILVGGNYLNLRDHLPLCNFRHPILRTLGIVFMTIAIPFALLFLGITLSVLLFGT